jgi:hypothetical protein
MTTEPPGWRNYPNFRGFWRHLRGHHYAVELAGAKHFSFTDFGSLAPQFLEDNPALRGWPEENVGSIDPRRALEVQRSYIAAFFDRYLRGRRSSLLTKSDFPVARLTVAGVRRTA